MAFASSPANESVEDLMRFVFALVAICCGLVAAAEAAPSDNAMLRCAAMTDQQARLACYDTLEPPTLTAPPPPLVSGVPQAVRPAPVKRGWFSGLFGRSTRPPATSYRVTARMTDFRIQPLSNIFTVALDNGQVWQQEQGDTTTAVLRKVPRNYIVTVEPGFLGSYNMHISDVGGVFKVRRIK
jgi:hypothetical protein